MGALSYSGNLFSCATPLPQVTYKIKNKKTAQTLREGNKKTIVKCLNNQEKRISAEVNLLHVSSKLTFLAVLPVMLSSKLLPEMEVEDNIKREQLLHGMQNLPVAAQIEKLKVSAFTTSV